MNYIKFFLTLIRTKVISFAVRMSDLRGTLCSILLLIIIIIIIIMTRERQ